MYKAKPSPLMSKENRFLSRICQQMYSLFAKRERDAVRIFGIDYPRRQDQGEAELEVRA
jgi:hypothetical protein